jgi:uncharacterized protein YjbJ (UPF0337 family)
VRVTIDPAACPGGISRPNAPSLTVIEASMLGTVSTGQGDSLTVEKGTDMSAADKAKDKVQVAKGKVKQGTGKATGDRTLEAEGQADQTKGSLKQAGEKVKDAFKS